MRQNMWSAPILILKVGCPSSSSWFCGSFNSWNVSVLAVAKWPWLHRKGDQEMTSFNRIMESLETKNQWLQMTPKLCNKFGSRHVRPPSPLNKKNSCLCLSVYLFFLLASEFTTFRCLWGSMLYHDDFSHTLWVPKGYLSRWPSAASAALRWCNYCEQWTKRQIIPHDVWVTKDVCVLDSICMSRKTICHR